MAVVDKFSEEFLQLFSSLLLYQMNRLLLFQAPTIFGASKDFAAFLKDGRDLAIIPLSMH
jgi:hypothetical protein